MTSFVQKKWYLIEAQLPEKLDKVSANLVIQTKKQITYLPLSVTYKGRLFEVVCLHQTEIPEQVEFDFGDDIVSEEIAVRIQAIPKAVAHYWMLHRVVFMWHIMPAKLRKRLGFFSTLKQSFYQGYRLLSSFRYHYPEPDYSQWLQRYWQLLPQQKKEIQQFIKKRNGSVSILIDVREATAEQIQYSQQSIQDQEGIDPTLIVWENQLPVIETDYVLYVKAGSVLRPWAVAWFMWQQQQQSQWQCIYSDHDHYTQSGQLQKPYFKPIWSLELQRSTAYVGDVVWFTTLAWHQQYQILGADFTIYAALLELGVNTKQIGRVSATLWAAPLDRATIAITPQQLKQLNQHLVRHQIAAIAELDTNQLGRVRYAMPEYEPLVSIIIPTRDMLHLLQPCVESILQKTQWSNYEIIIVDNQSHCEQTLNYMQQVAEQYPQVRILVYDDVFNYSAINNYAVDQAQGSVICLLNNDTEVISADWLDEMVSRVLQPTIGVVGARLYYTDGRVQHAGDVVGIGGGATHLHGILSGNDVGYMSRAVAAQDLSAVTAACLVTTKALYQKLGGLNQKQLTVAFNDVDYCLRVRQAGYRVIYTPYAELYHHESVSRGGEDTPEKKARAKAEGDYMRKQWPAMKLGDDYYNPNLNQNKADFSLAKAPNVDWPWK